MRNLYLVATVATVLLGACTTDSGITIKCTINKETKEFVTSPGREDCEKIRANPIAASTTAPTAPITPVTPATPPVPVVVTPLVLNTPGFLEPTSKTQRQNEVSAKLSTVERDPFVTIPGSVPIPTPPPAPRVTPRRVNNNIVKVIKAPIKPVEPPSTIEASAVLVSGILDIGGSKYAIINAPGEPTSRPVSLGQTFASGKVLFKRIDSISGAAFVILEQNGVEVPRPVGKQPVAEAPKPPQPANNLTLQGTN
jgi:hypothetical protein